MADPDHLKMLRQGVAAWNAWRQRAPLTIPNLSEASLPGADLRGADLRAANFSEANLYAANLIAANLGVANFGRANLSWADLSSADLSWANLSGADLSSADLFYARLVGVDITNANLTSCRIFGASVWGLKLSDQTRQRDLIITRRDEPEITVDDIEVAQFVYLLLNNAKIRTVIDTITSKAVLILGRFTAERKAVLDTLRDELRKRKYLPILFDFDKSTSLTTVETITLLARMARFVIADISHAKSVLQELQAIVPDLPSVPVQPVIIASQEEPGMFDFFRRYPWFLKVHRYGTPKQLLSQLSGVIKRLEVKALALRATTAVIPLNL
jgi:hypothetical protein